MKQSLCSYVEAVTGLNPTCKQKESVKCHNVVTTVQARHPARFENYEKIIHSGTQEKQNEEFRSNPVLSDSMEIVVL